MGAYLSSPNCDKETIEGSNDRLAFVASSMQGWRMSQEDAHNAILNFDDNTSLFAVYDGHGGAEIAVYCSRYLPDFLKKLDAYQDGRLKDALIEGFLKFDSVLLDPDVKKVLQKIASDENEDVEEQEEHPHEFVTPINPNEENHHNDELNAEEAQLLRKEAEVPIEELLKRYNTDEKKHFHSPHIAKRIIEKESESNGISTTKSTNSEENTATENVTEEKSTTEAEPSSSELKSTSRRVRKPVSEDSSVPVTTDIQSNSLIRHLLSDNTDELDDEDDDFELDASDEETSGDEAEGHDIDEENGESEDDEEESDESSKASQIQKLMRKSIMAILNKRAKKKSSNSDEVKENQNEENDDDEEAAAAGEEKGEEEEEEEGDDEDDDEEPDDEDETDFGMLEMDNDPGSSSGCTAVVTLLRDKQLYVANAGDSRCVVCRDGRAIEMSFDHKPEDQPERSRIEKAGYKVTLDGRVSGGLNLSRAIGDHAYKKTSSLPAEEQAITALPDIRTLTLDDQDEFMVIACDGIWNFMSSQDVVDFVRLRLEKKSLTKICEELFMHCLAPNTCGDGTGCDNMTAIIVKFNFNSPTKSLSNKRPLSPEHSTSIDTLDNSTNKKIKILTENGTNETKSPENFPLSSAEQTTS